MAPVKKSKKPERSSSRLGVWIVGVRGAIAVTVMAGVAALRKLHAPALGLVTESPLFADLDLAPLDGLCFGGCDIRREPLVEAAGRLVREYAALEKGIVDAAREDLDAIEGRISPGTARNCGEFIERLADGALNGGKTPAEELALIRGNIARFREENGLDRVVVVNLASTEPPLAEDACHQDPDRLLAAIAAGRSEVIRAGTLYACAAVLEGCPYINFTPSNSAILPAVVRLAERERTPLMGNDGKTGETLVKSALAPMFASRNLEVLSWEGFNILGNLDGKALDTPENRSSKLKTKDRVLEKILGYKPHSGVHIHYVPSLGDQKTAWDFIHFQGFLGARMSLQFTWQGYDSVLAAPLVLDLVRLTDLALRRGEAGLMPQLASFFKAPLGVEVFDHGRQFDMLRDYVVALKKKNMGK